MIHTIYHGGLNPILPTVLSIMLLPHASTAQEMPDFGKPELLTEWMEENGLDNWLEEMEEDAQQEFFGQLAQLQENPIDLNNASWEELEQVPFLSPMESDALCMYLYEHRPLSSLQELLLIEGWDSRSYRKVRPFITLQPLQTSPPRTQPDRRRWHNRFTQGHHTIRLQGSSVLQQKTGYQDSDSLRNLSKAYLGNPLKVSLLYQYKYGQNMRWGIGIEKDAGEKGPEGLTGYLEIRNTGPILSLVAGDFKATMGTGLVLSSGTFGGKMAAAARYPSSGNLMSPHASTGESGFFRGVGTELATRSKRWRAGAFVSYRAIDTQRSDSVFTSLKTDGMHRTVTEQEKKRNTRETVIGGRLKYAGRMFHISLNGLHYHFDGDWQPQAKPYNLYHFRGKDGWNLSLDSRFRHHNWLFSGELAFCETGAFAGIFQVNTKPHPNIDLSVSVRSYRKDYHAPYAHAFGTGSSAANETGVFLQMECRLIRALDLRGYIDAYSFPWLKYRVNAPSAGYEGMLEAEWNPTREFAWTLRYKVRSYSENAPAGGPFFLPPLQETTGRTVKSQWTCTRNAWKLKTTFLGNTLHVATQPPTFGFALSQDVKWTHEGCPLSLALQAALFDTDSYDNRISLYGPDMDGTMPFASVYGRGVRLVLLAGWQISPHLRWNVLLRHTLQDDRPTLGSGLETIDGNRQTYLGTTLKIKW